MGHAPLTTPRAGLGTRPSTDPLAQHENATDASWNIALAAARHAEQAGHANEIAAFAVAPGTGTSDTDLRSVPVGHPDAILLWQPETGWKLTLEPDHPQHALIDLYLPVCGATRARPIIVGHLGQSLDGFIATHSGDSQYVTGRENILHLHRMRALCDAIVVGAGTVAADDPQLTTRHVSGPSPLRVVLDPMRRLTEHFKVFRDQEAETLYICGRSVVAPGDTHFGRARLVAVADSPHGLDVAEVARLLHARGCHRIFVEGGGVTVSMFLEAHLLDRLQVAIAPLIIGSGRPAIRLPPRSSLRDCSRPPYRVFRMGGDVLFDCALKQQGDGEDEQPDGPPLVSRVI